MFSRAFVFFVVTIAAIEVDQFVQGGQPSIPRIEDDRTT